MHASVVRIFHYPDGTDWTSEDVDLHKIDTAVEAVLDLNGRTTPYIWLLPSCAEDDVPDEFLAVTGGPNEFRVVHYSHGTEFNFIDDRRSMSDLIEICSTRIMGTQPKRYLCNDPDTVCAIVSHFCETGDRHSSCQWAAL